MPTIEEIQQLAAKVGWKPENQQLWLNRKGVASWEEADADLREFAIDMMRESASMFGVSLDELDALRVYDSDDPDEATY